jgi:hypothetical protein
MRSLRIAPNKYETLVPLRAASMRAHPAIFSSSATVILRSLDFMVQIWYSANYLSMRASTVPKPAPFTRNVKTAAPEGALPKDLRSSAITWLGCATG